VHEQRICPSRGVFRPSDSDKMTGIEGWRLGGHDHEVSSQKGNKENKKPKADKTQSKANVSAYKAAQSQGKPASSPFAKKT
jgi:hypothetical protein